MPGRRRRGVALISVVSVLVLLMIVATPFLLSMRDSARRGETYVQGERVEAEAEALFEQVRIYLTNGVEHLERKRLDDLGPGAGAQGTTRPPDDATPTIDVLAELKPPAELVRQFNQLTGHEHRIWDVDVRDAQSKFDLNTCSVGVLANLLGRAELSGEIEATDDRITVSDLTGFPATDGVVRIGAEVVRYQKADVPSRTLLGCRRGYMADKVGRGAEAHAKGTRVMHEAAWQIAMRPFRARPGAWTRYTNVYEARAVSDLGVAALQPGEFERMRRFLTAWAGNVVGDGWCNPQTIRNNITAGDKTQLSAEIKNSRYFGPGTVVRITDGVNEDFAIVTNVRGTKVDLAGEIANDYLADQARVYTLARAAVNVNTADVETLSLVFDGLTLEGKASIDRKRAVALAQHLRKWTNSTNPDQTNPEVGVFRGWGDYVKALEEARDQELITGDDFTAVLLNSLNACDARLEFSTVPICFRSFDVYEARAAAMILGPQGQELARREMVRVFEVSSGRSSTSVLESQADFQEQIRISRDAKWFVTYPVNVNAHYEGVNEPPSEYQAFAQKSRFPDSDRSSASGHLQLREYAFRTGGSTKERYFHFDEQETPDGLDLEKQSFEVNPDAPYDVNARTVDIRRFVQVPQRNEDADLGLAPFACSFWYRPKWKIDSSEHVIFDYGIDDPFMNRVSLRYDGTSGQRLILAVSDATREQKACEVVYDFSLGDILWETDRWYHIACTVYGCSPEMMELFVDAEHVGTTPLLTRLRSQIMATGDITSIDVEDSSGFPDYGVLLIRGIDGAELFEYTRNNQGSFGGIRRKARNIDRVFDQTLEVPRLHRPGEVVQLYGYSAPLLTDVKRGGASLSGALGPWRAFRAIGEDDAAQSSGFSFPGKAIACIDNNVIRIREWETGSKSDAGVFDDLGPSGTEGVAVLIAPSNKTYLNGENQAAPFRVTAKSGGGADIDSADATPGGVDVVHYRVETSDSDGLKITLLRHGLVLRHWDSSVWVRPAGSGRFFLTYDFGDTATAAGTYLDPTTGQPFQYPGAITAFVPIGIVAQGANADYLDPVDQEPQLHPGATAGSGLPASAYVQIDGEWIKYDTFDQLLIPGKIAFYRDCDTSLTGTDGLPGLAARFGFGGINEAIVAPIFSPSSGQGGGGGTGGSSVEPPRATYSYNDESSAPPVPSTGNTDSAHQPPPTSFSTEEIARRLDFRSWEDRTNGKVHRIANTIARDHFGGALVVPCFAVWGLDEYDGTAAGRGACPGFDDLVTLRDVRGNDEQIRVQWGYKPPIAPGTLVQYNERAAWIGPVTSPVQQWNWDRPQEHQDIGRFPSQAWTRAVKFPSREMPDSQLTQSASRFRFGKRFDDGGNASNAIIDEVVFHELEFPEAQDRRDFAFLGVVPPELYVSAQQTQSGVGSTVTQPVRFQGIDDKTDEISVFMPFYNPGLQAYVISGLEIQPGVYRPDGGMIKIDDELILYASFDPSTGVFSGCLRGVCLTPAASHEYGAIVVPVEAFPITRLQSDADETSASFDLVDATDFAQDGCIRIDDSLEVVGYTEKEKNRLSGPLGRIDPATGQPVGSQDRLSGGALFRGRFATTATGYSAGAVVMSMPIRHYDRYAERSDDPENSYSQFSWTKQGAVWKRITWDELPVSNAEVIALVRFTGGPAWDDADRVIKVGQMQMPGADRRGWLYEITDPAAENLLNVEADRVEVRLMVRFDKGAYDRNATPRPNEWKDTPWIKRVLVEYVAPSSVLSQE